MATMNFKLHDCCGRYKSMSLSVIVTIWIPLPLRGIGISDVDVVDSLLLRERAHRHGVIVDFDEQDPRAVTGVVNHAKVPGRSVEFPNCRRSAVGGQRRHAVKGEVRAQGSA